MFEIDVTTLYLTVTPQGIEIRAYLDTPGCLTSVPFHDLVRPQEMFGGYCYKELLEIAQKRGEMDADELRV
jgi:hypothetical protein